MRNNQKIHELRKEIRKNKWKTTEERKIYVVEKNMKTKKKRHAGKRNQKKHVKTKEAKLFYNQTLKWIREWSVNEEEEAKEARHENNVTSVHEAQVCLHNVNNGQINNNKRTSHNCSPSSCGALVRFLCCRCCVTLTGLLPRLLWAQGKSRAGRRE